MKIRLNLRDGILPKRPKRYVLSFKLTDVAGSEEKITFNIRSGISMQGQKIFIIIASCDTFRFDSFGTGLKIRLNPRDGVFFQKA